MNEDDQSGSGVHIENKKDDIVNPNAINMSYKDKNEIEEKNEASPENNGALPASMITSSKKTAGNVLTGDNGKAAEKMQQSHGKCNCIIF
jgi:hypothetical protein